jgi:chromosome segregation ATPase
MIESIVTFASGALGLELVRRGFDAWLARRAAKDKRTETTATADATVKTRRIDDNAALRGELWERIEKLEKRQDECTRENGELREEIGRRDSAIANLTRDVSELRARADAAEARADRAEQKADAAETMCRSLDLELSELRKSVA